MADYQQALADYEEKRDVAVQAALAYAPSKREVDEARDRIEAAYHLVNQNIRPQGFLANKDEQSYEDAVSHAPTVDIEQAGEAREIHRLELGLSPEESLWHELIHAMQSEADPDFQKSYASESAARGYDENSYEVEANELRDELAPGLGLVR